MNYVLRIGLAKACMESPAMDVEMVQEHVIVADVSIVIVSEWIPRPGLVSS
jgi:hypothetical protein